jgi:hypothetical protein
MGIQHRSEKQARKTSGEGRERDFKRYDEGPAGAPV